MSRARTEAAAGQAHVLSSVAADIDLDLRESVEYLEGYYPSGTQQLAGSRLDELVEMVRALAIEKVRSRAASRTEAD